MIMDLKRRSLFWMATLFTGAALSTVAAAQSAPMSDLLAIRASGVLRVAITSFDLPAFHRLANGQLEGPEIDLARQIADALSIKLEIVSDAKSFDGVVDAVAGGQADIGISKLSQTYLRTSRVRFSEAYITLRHALLFDRSLIAAQSIGKSPEDALRHFSGRLGALRGSAYVGFARQNFPRAPLTELPNWDAAVEALTRGQLDAIYRDEFEIKRVLKLRPSLNVKYGAAIITDQTARLSVAICDNCGKLQEFINFHLKQVSGTITLKRLLASDLRD